MKEFLRKCFRKVVSVFKFFIKFIFMPLILIGGITVTIIIVCLLVKSNEDSAKYQLLIGLATSLFSMVLGANSVISAFINQAKVNNQKTEATISLINDFNNNYFEDLVFVGHSIRMANQVKSYSPNVDPIIDKAEHPATSFPSGVTYIDYKAEIIKYSFIDLYSKPNQISEGLSNYLRNNQNYGTNTVANQAIYYIFKQKRIRILNFFESMAIGIGNKITSGALLKNQFSDLLNKTIPLFAVFIYNEEGEECYPALRAMLMEWYSKKSK